MLTLVIGNKNLSSWSLRPWLVLKHFGFAFHEVKLPLDTPEFHATIVQYSPARRVPCSSTATLHIWDSLAIAEYLNEKAQGAPGRPIAALARCARGQRRNAFGLRGPAHALADEGDRAQSQRSAAAGRHGRRRSHPAALAGMPCAIRRSRPVVVRRLLDRRCDVRAGGAALPSLRRAAVRRSRRPTTSSCSGSAHAAVARDAEGEVDAERSAPVRRFRYGSDAQLPSSLRGCHVQGALQWHRNA